jgi:hypothetical protein
MSWGTLAGERLRGWLRSERVLFWLHIATLVFAFGFLLYVNRDQWFNADEFGPILYRRLVGGDGYIGVWDPANSHWLTLTVLVYRALFNLFGLRSYVPYVAMLALLQVIATHLFWRLLRRSHVDPLVAILATLVFAVLGPAVSILTQSYGIENTGSLTLGLAALLIAPDDGPLQKRDLGAGLLLIGSLMFFSATGIPLVAIVGVRLLLSRGPKVAAAVLALPVGAFFLWYATYGHKAREGPYQESLGIAIRKMPEFVWTGITGAIDKTASFPGVGAVVVVLLVLWIARKGATRTVPWPVVLAFASGTIVYLMFVTVGRSRLGPDAAASSRYVYAIIAFLLPVLAIAASSRVSFSALRTPLVVFAGVVLLIVQVSTLSHDANLKAGREQEEKRKLLAAAEIAASGDRLVTTPVPRDYVGLSPVTVPQLRRLVRDGKLPDEPKPGLGELFEARLYLQTSVSLAPIFKTGSLPRLAGAINATSAPGTTAGCTALTPEAGKTGFAALRFRAPGSVQLRRTRADYVMVALSSDELKLRTGFWRVRRPHDPIVALNVSITKADVLVAIPPGTTTQICPATTRPA